MVPAKSARQRSVDNKNRQCPARPLVPPWTMASGAARTQQRHLSGPGGATRRRPLAIEQNSYFWFLLGVQNPLKTPSPGPGIDP